jgi:hypothetical protein
VTHYRTAQEVVDALGGLDAVCELTGAPFKTAWNWSGRAGTFPACYYAVMTRALLRRGASAPAWLWKQRGVKKGEV